MKAYQEKEKINDVEILELLLRSSWERHMAGCYWAANIGASILPRILEEGIRADVFPGSLEALRIAALLPRALATKLFADAQQCKKKSVSKLVKRLEPVLRARTRKYEKLLEIFYPWRKITYLIPGGTKTIEFENTNEAILNELAETILDGAKENRALAAGTGARAGELFALRVEADVNLSEQTITIRRSVFEGEENTSKSDTGDEDRTRTVPIDPSVAMELKKHLKGRRSGYLFETRNGTPLRLSNVLEDKLQPILRKLKLVQPGMGMHAFRRGRISHLVYSGVSRQVIRDWCGHSSDKMIDHYTKMLRQHHAPEMAKVKPLLGRSWTPVGPQLVEGRVAR